jgi:uncharacterized protein (DUF1697 family)
VTRYAAFLRAINVGKRKATAPHLVAVLSDLGFENGAAFLASGNIVFDTSMSKTKLEPALESALEEALGFHAAAFVRTGADLVRIAAVAESPALRPSAGETVHVAFLRKPPTAAVKQAVAAASLPEDVLEIHGRELYWLRRGRMMESTLPKGSWPEDLVGIESTMRNVNTVNRMLAKFF